MPAIASTGAMLSSGHQRHQLEVGLSLPNLIQTSLTRLGALGQVFGTSDPDQAPRSTALIEQAITLIDALHSRFGVPIMSAETALSRSGSTCQSVASRAAV